MAAAGLCISNVTVQFGSPAKLTAKSVFSASAGPAGVTPSASNSCAVIAAGAASHIPPSAGFGSRSVIVVFQAGESPTLCTFRVKVSGKPTRMLIGPAFSIVRSGSTTVIGPLVPGSPGLSVAASPSVRL